MVCRLPLKVQSLLRFSSATLGVLLGLAVFANMPAAAAGAGRIKLGTTTANGGIAIHYNNSNEIPTNIAYYRAQVSVTNTNGGEYNFDTTPIPGSGGLQWWNPLLPPGHPASIFQSVSNQFGLDLVLAAPTNSISVPTLNAYDNSPTNTPINASPVTWAISNYQGGALSGPVSTPGSYIINSLFRSNPGAGVGVTLNPPVVVEAPPGTFTATMSGELQSDNLIHWYTATTPDSPVSNFELTGKIFFSGTLVYTYNANTAIDPADVDFFAGPMLLEAEVICGDRYVNKATGLDFFPGSIPNNCRNTPVAVPCKTIQRTVDIACAGDTVNVAAGNYAEQITIPKNLTVIGAGATTVIEPTSVVSNTTKLSSGASAAPIILVKDATSVTIKNLVVDGTGAAFASCAPGYFGVYYRNAGGSLQNTTVQDVVLPTAVGCQDVVGVLGQSQAPAPAATLAVTGNTVTNYGKNGITCSLSGITCNITGNTVTGRGHVPSGDAAQNGIQISAGAAGTVLTNTISGNYYSPMSACSTGVLVFGSNGISVVGNNLSDNLCDLLIQSDGNTVDGNNIPVANEWPFSVIGNNNAVTKNYVKGSVYDGVYLDGLNNTLTCNRIENNAGNGISIDTLGGFGTTVGTPTTINSNMIQGNLTAGLDASLVTTTPLIDAQNNYWGCATGANTPGCDAVVGVLVDVLPAAATPPLCVTCAASGGDVDNDDVCTPVDNCPLVANTNQANADGDAAGDACDVCANDPLDDVDGDGLCANVDNCPAISNPGQSDIDQDGLGDVCDANSSAGSLVLSRVKLRIAPRLTKATGLIQVSAVVNTKDTPNVLVPPPGAPPSFQVAALANAITLRITDSATYNVLVPLTNCQVVGVRGSLRCRSADRKISASFQARRFPGGVVPAPYLGEFSYAMTLAVSGLSQGATGTTVPVGPVNVEVKQGPTVTRTDAIGDLSPCSGSVAALVCRGM